MKKVSWMMAAGSVLLCGTALVLWHSEAQAQGASRGPVSATITKVDSAPVRSPAQTVTSHAIDSSAPSWLQLTAKYTTKNGQGRDVDARSTWQEELTVEWYVLLTPRGRQGKPILMHRTVTYMDLDDKKREHYADLYIRPAFIKRYCGASFNGNSQEMKMYVQIKVGGQTLHKYTSDTVETAKWWEWEPPRVELRHEELLTRDETPFAAMDYDYYEHIKKAPSAGR
jgi:hypothetical protein